MASVTTDPRLPSQPQGLTKCTGYITLHYDSHLVYAKIQIKIMQ